MKLFERLFHLVCVPIANLVNKYDEIKAKPKEVKPEPIPTPDLVRKTPKPRTRRSTKVTFNGASTPLTEAVANLKIKYTQENINRLDRHTEELNRRAEELIRRLKRL